MGTILPHYGIFFLPVVPGSKEYALGGACQERNGNVVERRFLEGFISLMEHSVLFPNEFL